MEDVSLKQTALLSFTPALPYNPTLDYHFPV
jgi:hypothetical protein